MNDRTPSADRLGWLRAATIARVGLGRVGAAIPTAAALDFQLSHALAKDAVEASLPKGALGDQIAGRQVVEVASQAPDRGAYLMRPDLGRLLTEDSRARLAGVRGDLAIVLADGLSATAVLRHGPALAEALIRRAADWKAANIVVAHQARVAIGDDIGEAAEAKAVVVLIGERPGLSAADSLSAYITWAPRRGRLDSERSCVSNIRPPHGLSIEAAADEIMHILHKAQLCNCTGVGMLAALSAPRQIEG